MKGISVIINVVREEVPLLPRVISSVESLADEIVLVDMSSGEEVKKIAKKYKAKVYKHEFVNYVEPARNFGMSKATREWILILDPDERVSRDLAYKLREIREKGTKTDYYRLPRKNIIFGKWMRHSRWWPDYNIRFFKKGRVAWNEIIHGVPLTKGKGGDLEASEKNALIHYHYSSIEQFLGRMDRYTRVQADLKVKEGYQFDWKDLLTKPGGEFLARFFQAKGYKDGVHGLALALLQAFSELVLYLKIWQITKFKEQHLEVKEVVGQMRKLEKDLHYWQANALVETGGGVLPRLKRKFKLP
jgi:(heptosyl)LPS beta-1,4-glucosyltransferase